MPQELRRKIDEIRERADALREHYAGSPEEREVVFSRAFEELSVALEELNVTAEELRLQSDELSATRVAVESERRRYRDLFELAPDGYIVTSASGHIEEVNQAAARMLGVQQNHLVRLPLLLFVREPERGSFRIRLANLASHDDAEPWDCTLKPRRGEPFPASITVGHVRDGRGNITGLRWLIRDVRDRVRAEKAALERGKTLELGAE